MIELNLTYEESKKILELGYDFGKKFGDIYQKKDSADKYMLISYDKITAREYGNVSEKYADSDVELFVVERLPLNTEDAFIESKQHVQFELGEVFSNPNRERFVPIISKAALEACLPVCIVDWKQKRTFYLSYDGYKTPYYRKSYEKPDGTIGSSYTAYESAYKAFIWCHENYQEELRNKFEEVMK